MPSNDQKIIAQIIARCWDDPAYKAAVFANPTEEFRKAGVDMELGDVVNVYEASFSNRHVVIPPKPPEGSFTAEQAVALYSHSSRSMSPPPSGGARRSGARAKRAARKSGAKKSAARKGSARKGAKKKGGKRRR